MARKKNYDLRVAYIFHDCHAVLIYKKEVPEAPMGFIEVVEVIEQFCNRAPKGRLVVHDTGYLAALKDASIKAHEPSLQEGSEGSREKGLLVASVSWTNAYGFGSSCSIPSVISNGFTYQPNFREEKFEDLVEGNLWGDNKIVKIHRVKVKK